MKLTPARAARGFAIAGAVIGYPVAAHYSTTAPGAPAALGVAVSLLPSLAILAALAWRSPRRGAALLACGAVAALLWGFWGTLERNFNWVYFLQHAGTNVMLALAFGATLARGRKALCTHFAEAVHGGALAPEVLRYTRQVTAAWTVFFVALSVVSSVLFFFFSIEAWSVFANFLTLPLVLLMFAAEYGVRRLKLPKLERHGIMDGILAFWKTPPGTSPR
ncbi:MAG: COG4648 family protein [Thiobacillus sp.]